MQAENGRSSTSPVGWGIKKAVPIQERLCAVSGNTQLPGLAGLVILSTPALGLVAQDVGLDTRWALRRLSRVAFWAI
jgi:hypothetical protein